MTVRTDPRPSRRRMWRTTEPAVAHGAALAGLLLAACVLPPAGARADEPPATDAAPEPEVVSIRIPEVTRFPDYPPQARRDRIEGEATVCFKITPDGRVLDPVIAGSSHKIFEKPALAAIRASTFEPLGPGEMAAAERTCRTFRFRLGPADAKDAA